MIHFTEQEIDSMILEDVPFIDLTSSILKLHEKTGTITYRAREDLTVSGTELSARLMSKFNLRVEKLTSSGTFCLKGAILLEASGDAYNLHRAWKVCVNLIEHMSGIASQTAQFMKIVRDINPLINVVTTRKSMPGNKKAVVAAIMDGGALPHRLGLSETILIFDQHYTFFGGLAGFLTVFKDVRHEMKEKKITIEVKSIDDAIVCAGKGFDILQIDKMPPDELTRLIRETKKIQPDLLIAAAGGININNAPSYAKTGADILVLSSLYHAMPADIGVTITPV